MIHILKNHKGQFSQLSPAVCSISIVYLYLAFCQSTQTLCKGALSGTVVSEHCYDCAFWNFKFWDMD